MAETRVIELKLRLAEEALGRERERAEKTEAARSLMRDRLDALITAGFGATTDTLRQLRAALDDQETTDVG